MSCNRSSGACFSECKRKYYGFDCTQDCPLNCGGYGVCEKNSGICTDGCKAGWNGTKCESGITTQNAMYTNIMSVKEEQRASKPEILTPKPVVTQSKPPKNADDTTYYNSVDIKKEVAVSELKAYVANKLSTNKYEEEFQAIPYGAIHPTTVAETPKNMKKNRFKTTFPYDHSRVVLKGKSDYINANFVERKCEQYWPKPNEKVTHGQFGLSLLDERHFSYYSLRELEVLEAKSKQSRKILQYHFTTWPDHGTPDPLFLVLFHKRVISKAPKYDGPILVHCSAGIGRTGTFIALDALESQGNNTGAVDIEKYVRIMRKDRMNMIQTSEQYKVLHEALVEAFQWQDTYISMDDFPSEWQSIETDKRPLNQQRLKREYDVCTF
ncbi:hypothetical protein FSP39_019280 [Pinctada imbricata]|uniref:Protein-tyrosine-phosphatase n=1 Tax=Pinctada imbricata TaxID=66713 RepID=A0AA88Y0B1_PINIB|nr:hypothetical protein FSP39_019280 [Pinctada imbricata]